MRAMALDLGRYVCRVAPCATLVLALVCRAQAERLPVKAYTLENGLAHNRVKRIVQDSHGFLWFCTAAGLSRFAIHEDQDLWNAAPPRRVF